MFLRAHPGGGSPLWGGIPESGRRECQCRRGVCQGTLRGTEGREQLRGTYPWREQLHSACPRHSCSTLCRLMHTRMSTHAVGVSTETFVELMLGRFPSEL